MMSVRIPFILGVLSLYLGAAPAQAAEEKLFSGGYVGGEVGYSHANLVVTSVGSESDGGVYFGGFLGARHQSDNGVVIGAEAYGGATTNSFVLGLVDTGRILGIDGVLGYAKNKVLVFTTVGYVNGKLTIPVLALSDTRGAVRYGVGVEVNLGKKISGRIKVTRAVFKEMDVRIKDITATAAVVVGF